MRETEILNGCIERLNELPNMTARLLRRQRRDEQARFIWDGVAEIKTPQGRWRGLLEVKQRLTVVPARHWVMVLQELYRQAGLKDHVAILCTDYIGDTVAQELRAQKANFVDVAGNMFLNLPRGPYIYVEGKRPLIVAGRKPGRLFEPTGLKILLTLLLDPEAINWPYRAIAEDAGVALGTVGWVMRDLRERGFVKPVGPRKGQLINRRELFDRWVAGYAEKLRPKLVLGRYRAKETDLGQVLKWLPGELARKRVQWALTGGIAADLLIGHYRGEALTLFANGWTPKVVRALRWLPAADGPVTILNGFGNCTFKGPTIDQSPLAATPLIYAELLHMGGDRAGETAEIIRKKYIEEKLREP
ncbi:MAG: type IV toxin-antitoxin system AbiEi family antitoxin [Actinomycetota bacterium]